LATSGAPPPVAVLLNVQLDGVVHLGRRVGELAGVGQDQPDLDGLRERGRHGERREHRKCRD